MSTITTNYAGDKALKYLLGGTTYIGLHTRSPGVLADAGSELAGGSYVRQPTKWTEPGSKMTGQISALRYLNLPACTIWYLGVWDAQVGGHLLFYIEIPPKAVAEGGGLVVAASDLAIWFD
jgi:hypothetical protein